MKSKRLKSTQNTISREDAERVMNEIAVLVNRQRVINAEIDSIRIAAGEKYETELAGLDQKLSDNRALMKAWSDGNPEEFGNRKSVEFSAGVCGFRTGTPKVKTRGGFTLARVLEKLKSIAWGDAYVRVKEEVDKEALIAAHGNTSISEAELREVGVSIVQEEIFFVEPKLTETETRIAEAA